MWAQIRFMDFIVFSCILCDTNYTHNQSAHPTASPRSALAAPGRLLRAVSGGGAGAGAGARRLIKEPSKGHKNTNLQCISN